MQKIIPHELDFCHMARDIPYFHIARAGLSALEPREAARIAGLMGSQDTRIMVEAWKQGMHFDSRRRLHDIHCPTLVVAASEDNGVPRHHATMLHEGIAGSELVVVNGANHALIWTHPTEFVRVVSEFLGRLSRDGCAREVAANQARIGNR